MSTEALYGSALSAAFWVALWGASRKIRGGHDAARLVVGLALGAACARVGGLLFTALGLLVTAPREHAARRRFLDATLPALPLAFATAKLGCFAVGCCTAPAAEALAFLALAGVAHAVPAQYAAPFAAAGVGAVRLAVLPFRPEALLSAWPALLWLAHGALRCGPSEGGPGCLRPGSEISNPTARSSKPGSAAGSATPAGLR